MSVFDLDYKDLYKLSISNHELFWNEVAKDVVWNKPYESVIEDKFSSSPKWFVGGKINACYNCLDKHVEDGHGDEIAVIHDSPITKSTQSLTYNQMLHSVSILAGILVNRCDIKIGDIVLLYFPVIPECLMSMLACARIGATYVVVYGGFSVKELAARMQNTEPKLIITCNVGPELDHLLNYKDKIDNALKINGVSSIPCLVYNRPHFNRASMKNDFDLDWEIEMLHANPQGPVSLDSNHPLFIIYTSGTTGEPKGLVLLTGGTVVHNKYAARYILGCKPKETVWAVSDFGWVLGQSIMSYGALMMRMKTVLYEGKIIGTPDNLQFTRVLNSHKVSRIVCPPTVMRILKRFCSTSELKLNYNGLRSIILGGEICDQNILQWVSETFKCPINIGWGQTELCGIVVNTGFILKNQKENFWENYILPAPGLEFKIVDRNTGIEQPYNTLGRIVLKLPTLPSLANTLHRSHERFLSTYFERYPGFFDTMDAGTINEDGALKIEARDDDIIHVASARICGGAIEDACLRNKNIIESVVIALEDNIKGFVPFAFLVCSATNTEMKEKIIRDTIETVNDIIGEVACFQKAVIVPDIPKTINNKVHRSSLVAMLNGRTVKIPTTIANPQVYPIIYDILKKDGYYASMPLSN